MARVPRARALSCADSLLHILCLSRFTSLTPSLFLSFWRTRALSLSHSLSLAYSMEQLPHEHARTLSRSLSLSLSFFLSLSFSLLLARARVCACPHSLNPSVALSMEQLRGCKNTHTLSFSSSLALSCTLSLTHALIFVYMIPLWSACRGCAHALPRTRSSSLALACSCSFVRACFPPSFSFSLVLSHTHVPCLALTLSLFLPLSHSYPPPCSMERLTWLCQIHSFSLLCAHARTLSLSPSLPFLLPLPLYVYRMQVRRGHGSISCSRSLFLTHDLLFPRAPHVRAYVLFLISFLSRTHTHKHTHTHTLSLSLSLAHTHTRTHSDTVWSGCRGCANRHCNGMARCP